MLLSNRGRIGWSQTFAMLVLASVIGSNARSQESDSPIPIKLAVTPTFDDLATNLVIGLNLKQQPQLSEYWLGVDGLPADDAMRSQLELPEGHGLVLQQVVDGSPAAKAGLKPYDVLLTAADKALSQTSDLAALIAEKKEQPIRIKLIRRGRQILVEARPERRPSSETGDTCPTISHADDAEFITRAMQELIGNPPTADEIKKFTEDAQEAKRTKLVNRLLRASTVRQKSCTSCHAPTDNSLIQVLGRYIATVPVELAIESEGTDRAITLLKEIANPGDTTAGTIELPDDLTITITRRGKQPAKISVQRSDVQSWDSSSDQLDQLPADIRGHVDRILGIPKRDPRHEMRYWKFETGDTNLHATAPAVAATTSNAIVERLAQQLEKLQSEYDEARKTLQELRNSLPAEPNKADAPKR